jgi:hypothetical protein
MLEIAGKLLNLLEFPLHIFLLLEVAVAVAVSHLTDLVAVVVAAVLEDFYQML